MTAHWDQAARSLRRDLSRALSTDLMRDLHQLRPWRHAWVVVRQLLILSAAVFVILKWGEHAYAWIPASIAIGLWVFNGTILLHEVVHRLVSLRTPKTLLRLLALLYATPSGLSATQFERWHLDHHDHLGTTDLDPKRAYLSPKRASRLLKLAYFTFLLFPIYFRAAAKAAATYDAPTQRRIRMERIVTTLFHGLVLASLWLGLGVEAALKLHIVPVFVVFPIAFSVNRIGQHYDIRSDDPATWTTWMRSSPLFWDALYLWSNYHLEHHYYPRVPFYNLRRLHRALTPFLRERGVSTRSYGGLLYGWLIENKVPHSDWRPEGLA